MAPTHEPAAEVTAAIALLEELVAFPTVSRTSNAALLAWLGEHLEARGARVQVVEGPDDGRANLVATIGPAPTADGATSGAVGAPPAGVLLSGHTDVVPPGEGWASDPFALTAVDDRLVARGAADMKGFLAAALVALDRPDRGRWRAPVHLVASYDEEIGCQGVRHVLPLLGSLDLHPELVVIGEPTMMRPRYSHLGKQMYRVVVRAAEAHSSRAAVAPSAIAEAAELVGVLSSIQAACPPAQDADSPLYSPPYSLNCGTIHGGTAANVIAAECEVVFEVRHDIHHDPTDILAPFRDAVAQVDRRLAAVGGGATCELTNHYPALATDPTVPAFARAVHLADQGPAVPLGFGTEGGLLATVLDAPIMICGPGDIADAHRPDEFVEVQQLERCVQFLRGLIDTFCLPPGP